MISRPFGVRCDFVPRRAFNSDPFVKIRVSAPVGDCNVSPKVHSRTRRALDEVPAPGNESREGTTSSPSPQALARLGWGPQRHPASSLTSIWLMAITMTSRTNFVAKISGIRDADAA